MIDVNIIKRDMKKGITALLEEYQWGSHLISLFNEFDGMCMIIRNENGMALKCLSPEYFISNINTHNDFYDLVNDALKDGYIK